LITDQAVLVLQVVFQYFEPIVVIGQGNPYLEVESASTEEGLINHLHSVRGPDHQHILLRRKAIHFGQKLVNSRVFLTVGSLIEDASLFSIAYRIDFIDINNGWSLLFRSLEQIPHSLGTNAHVHLTKL
jgi:hypothetical protein